MVLFLKPTVLFAFALQPNLQQEQQQQQQQQRLRNTTITTTTIPLRCTKTTTVLSSLSSSAIHQDETGKCVFGKKEYWDDVYQPDDENANANEKNNRSSSKTIASYSWYCNWNVLKPFWNELVVKKEGEGTYNTTNVNDNTTKNDGCYDSHKKHILIAGIGNDSTPFDMYYQDGWTNMTAFDYSHAGIERARALFRERQQQQQQQEEEVHPLIVTASIDRIKLRKDSPSIDLDQTLSGRVTYVGSSSMEIKMHCRVVGDKEPWLEAYFTFVTLDPETKKPMNITPLLPQNAQEQVDFDLGAKKAALKKQRRKEHKQTAAEVQEHAERLLQEAQPVLLHFHCSLAAKSLLMSATKMQNAMIVRYNLYFSLCM